MKPGEIHALMGENGAGKSTFIKVITGVHQPNEGEIYLKGENVSIKNIIIKKCKFMIIEETKLNMNFR